MTYHTNHRLATVFHGCQFETEEFIFYNIYIIYMKKIRVELATRLEVEGILGFVERHVTPFGTGAKVDCPKEYLGKRVFLVILRD